MKVLHDAVVAEWEIFQVRHELDAGLAGLLDCATEAEDASLGLVLGFRLCC